MAGSDIITLSSPDVLCEYVPLPEITKFLAQRVAVGPDLAAILIRDGEVVVASAGAHIAVGGFWQRLKERIGGTHALRLLIADLKPFASGGGFSAVSRDNVPVDGDVTLELQVNPEAPGGVLAFASDTDVVTKASVYARLAPHLDERVLKALVRDADAMALKGDPALQDRIQGAVMREAERVFGAMGLLVNSVAVRFALNEEEAAAIAMRAAAREDELYAARAESLKRRIALEAEVTTLTTTEGFDLERLRLMNAGELAEIARTQEIAALDQPARAARERRIAELDAELAQNRMREQEGLRARLAGAQTERSVQAEMLAGRVDVASTERIVQREVLGGRLDAAMNEEEIASVRRRMRTLDFDVEEDHGRRQSALWKLQQFNQLDVLQRTNEVNFDERRRLGDFEDVRADRGSDRQNRDADAAHRRQQEARRADVEGQIALLKAKGELTPDHLLAINAGMSPENAAIFVERARAEGRNEAEKTALLLDMLGQVRADAANFAGLQKDAAVGVAQGAGGNRTETLVVCPNCRTQNPAEAAFCKRCGDPLRPAQAAR